MDLGQTAEQSGAAASHLSPFTGDPARGRAAPQAAADADRRLVVARAVGGREGLGEVAALAQGDAVLEAGAALRRALRGRRRRCQERTRLGGAAADSECHHTSDQSRVTHLGGQDWLLQASRSMGRWVRQWVSSSVSSSAGPIFLMHRTVLVLMPPSHVFPHSDQSPMNHLEDREGRAEAGGTAPELVEDQVCCLCV